LSHKDFDGDVVLITGASTGLGRAIAVEVASRGAKAVIINYARSKAEADETAALVRHQGAEPVVVQGDVAEDAACRAIAAAAEPFGKVDALFNNAGVTKMAQNHGDLDAVNAEDFQWLYAVNVVGAFQMVRAARPLLEATSKPSSVVMTSSVAGAMGIGSSVPYAASKGALITMTLSLGRALAPTIRVNAICPGFIATPWFEKGLGPKGLEEARERIKNSTPLKVASEAEDIAPAAVFLASPAARHITGETLFVDAGAHLGRASLSQR